MINAVIFDMDGVLIDSEIHWRGKEVSFLKELVPGWNSELKKKTVGISTSDIYDLLRLHFKTRMSRREFIRLYSHDRVAMDIFENRASLLPGVLNLIKELDNQGLTLAVASSSPRLWIDTVMKRFKLGHLFDRIISAEHLGGRGKPEPDIYVHAARQLGRKPGECIAIEDTENGVISAKRAGMECIAIRNGFNDEQDLSGADFEISKFNEVLGIIKELNSRTQK